MTQLERRIRGKKWNLLNREVINGAHAGNIFRVDVLDHKKQRGSYVYKEFATERNNEIVMYGKLTDTIEKFSKTVHVWDTAPQAILMQDLKLPVKDNYPNLTVKDKKELLSAILHKLSDLHLTNLKRSNTELPIHQINVEWRNWCLEELKKLCTTHHWAKSDWMKIIEDTYDQLSIDSYEVRSPLVLTHGDPHLENIFHYHEDIWLIDWEWAAIGSPLRDITILLQDIYDLKLINFVHNLYWKLLKGTELAIVEEGYKKDFNYLYIDHTTMMLAWEIHKYYQGYTDEDRIKEMTEFKIREISRIAKEESDH
ncbi:phosphotransferase [Alkalihalobacillus macyae]|uniref:phosphotransferase n=1 Tax=Guptibacillus hwajinpoensis TaxID=208199 RepID=UPI00273A75AF|nr:phosphotransferase [Alkalihalobacillus macyae]MDP4549577.1 phosphotransferase [Alkalihalobacillus macyae]